MLKQDNLGNTPIHIGRRIWEVRVVDGQSTIVELTITDKYTTIRENANFTSIVGTRVTLIPVHGFDNTHKYPEVDVKTVFSNPSYYDSFEEAIAVISH